MIYLYILNYQFRQTFVIHTCIINRCVCKTFTHNKSFCPTCHLTWNFTEIIYIVNIACDLYCTVTKYTA